MRKCVTHSTEQNLLLLSRCGDVTLYLGTGWGGACRCFHDQVHHPICTGAHSYSTTTHCKKFLSLASPFLLRRNASIFFSHFIFFSLLCRYRLCRWHCSWSTSSAFRLVTHHTLFQFSCYHRYRLYNTLILSDLILYCTKLLLGNSNFRDEKRCRRRGSASAVGCFTKTLDK